MQFWQSRPQQSSSAAEASSFGHTVAAHTLPIRVYTALEFAVLISNVLFDLVAPFTLPARAVLTISPSASRKMSIRPGLRCATLLAPISQGYSKDRSTAYSTQCCSMRSKRLSAIGSRTTKLFDIRRQIVQFLLLVSMITIDRCHPFQDPFLISSETRVLFTNGI
jgi:hypothetical protein